MKAYSLDTICNLRSVSTLLSSNAAVRAPSLHDVQGGDDGLHLYDHSSQTSHAPRFWWCQKQFKCEPYQPDSYAWKNHSIDKQRVANRRNPGISFGEPRASGHDGDHSLASMVLKRLYFKTWGFFEGQIQLHYWVDSDRGIWRATLEDVILWTV